MSDIAHRLDSWTRYQSTKDQDLERLAILRQTPHPNPEYLMRPTRIRRTGRGFSVRGKGVEPGEIVVVDAFTAEGLIKMQRAERVQEGE